MTERILSTAPREAFTPVTRTARKQPRARVGSTVPSRVAAYLRRLFQTTPQLPLEVLRDVDPALYEARAHEEEMRVRLAFPTPWLI